MSVRETPEEAPVVGGGGVRTAAQQRRLGVLAVVLAMVGLSSGSSLVKFADTSGVLMAFWRMAIGTVVWLGVVAATRTPLPWSVVRKVAPAGVLFGINIAFFFSAVQETRVANAEFIGTLTPVFTAPLAALVLKERVRWGAFAYGLPAIAGVALIVFNAPSAAGENSLKGDLLALCAVLTWVVFLLTTKRVRPYVGVTQFMTTMSVFAALALLPLAIGAGDMFSLTGKAWALAVVVALVNGVMAHGLIVWAQRHVEVSTISMLQVGQPAIAATWAFLLLGETVAPLQVVGMVVVLVSMVAFTVASTRP